MDDSEPILCLLEAILGKLYKVVAFPDGMAAMKWLSEGNKPDLIISDVQMPLIDGWELARHINSSALLQGIPLIILSGSDHNEIVAKCELYGVEHYFHKPFDPVQLMEKVTSIFSSLALKKKDIQPKAAVL